MSQTPGTWSVVTPEAVPLDLQPAGLGSRLLAVGIDWATQATVAIALILVVVPLTDSLPAGYGTAAVVVVLSLLILGYPVVCETLWRGRTPGKAALGLRVVTVEGAPVRFRHAVIRAALGLVDFALTTGAAASISVLSTRRNQRLGDLAAGTLVLRERSGRGQSAPAWFGVPAALNGYAAALDISRLGEAEYRLARGFLLRAGDITAEARHPLAVSLAERVLTQVSPAPPAGVDPEVFLVCVVAACQQASARAAGVGSAPPHQ
ncbi:MAG: RDD family protein [Acidimicrobiales bacterium]